MATRVNYFRLFLFFIIVSVLYIALFTENVFRTYRLTRSPIVQDAKPFVYRPQDWPSIGPSTDLTGYVAKAPGYNPNINGIVLPKMPTAFQTEAAWSIAVNKESALINGCGTAPAGSYGTQGTCWWSCGSTTDATRTGPMGFNCLREHDISECVGGAKAFTLTFDDGPQPSTLNLLKILKDKGLKVTFFLVGAHMGMYHLALWISLAHVATALLHSPSTP